MSRPKKTNVDKFLGYGANGYVFSATSIPKQIPTHAVKIFFLDGTNFSEDENQRIVREYKLMEKLSHANVVKTFAFVRQILPRLTASQLLVHIQNDIRLTWKAKQMVISSFRLDSKLDKEPPVDSPIIYFRMELCGLTLRHWLKNVRPTREQTQYKTEYQIILGIAKGVRFLHEHNICHRDLKPENVMFSYSFSNEYEIPVKIGDFGVSRRLHVENSSPLTVSPGTQLYSAPETNSEIYDFRSDLYSLGLLIWEVLQCIPSNQLKSYFDRLANDSEVDLVHDHPYILRAKEIITGLVKRRANERISCEECINLIQEFGIGRNPSRQIRQPPPDEVTKYAKRPQSAGPSDQKNFSGFDEKSMIIRKRYASQEILTRTNSTRQTIESRSRHGNADLKHSPIPPIAKDQLHSVENRVCKPKICFTKCPQCGYEEDERVESDPDGNNNINIVNLHQNVIKNGNNTASPEGYPISDSPTPTYSANVTGKIRRFEEQQKASGNRVPSKRRRGALDLSKIRNYLFPPAKSPKTSQIQFYTSCSYQDHRLCVVIAECRHLQLPKSAKKQYSRDIFVTVDLCKDNKIYRKRTKVVSEHNPAVIECNPVFNQDLWFPVKKDQLSLYILVITVKYKECDDRAVKWISLGEIRGNLNDIVFRTKSFHDLQLNRPLNT